MDEASTIGLISKTPHFNSVSNYMASPEITPILKSLVTLSALPLKSIETDFAVDSSGFSTCVYDRWYDAKYGKERTRQSWVKAHLMCGVQTHIITSVEISGSADNALLPTLVSKTAENFSIGEVSADKAYLTRDVMHAIDIVGGMPYIPFKVDSTARGGTHHKTDELWTRMFHYYNFNRNEFMAHYHKRSNVESAFSMIKAKFGGFVRSKSPVGQVNEVLCKVICHNICVLIQSMHELGIEPVFNNKN